MNIAIQSLYTYTPFDTRAAYDAAFPGAAPYDPSQQPKRWATAPLAAGADPTAFLTFQYITANPSNTAAIYETFGLSAGVAATYNVPPDPTPTNPSPVYPAQCPIPCNPLPAGYTMTDTPFGIVISSPAAAAPAVASTPDSSEVRILAGINALLAQANLPQV